MTAEDTMDSYYVKLVTDQLVSSLLVEGPVAHSHILGTVLGLGMGLDPVEMLAEAYQSRHLHPSTSLTSVKTITCIVSNTYDSVKCCCFLKSIFKSN